MFPGKWSNEKKIRSARGIGLLLAVCLLLGMPFLTERVSAAIVDIGGIHMDVSVGLNGHYRYGAGIPVKIEMTSQKDFEGSLRLIVPRNGSDNNMAYEKDLVLSANSPKTVSMTVYTDAMLSYMGVEILDNKGKVVSTQEIMTETAASDRPLVGILSNDYTALDYFNAVQVELSNGTVASAEITELTGDTLPGSLEEIASLSYLIINSYDTSSLSAEQQNAVLQWVKEGGVLILGLGPDSRQTTAMFDREVLQVNKDSARSGSLTVWGNSISMREFTEGEGISPITVEEGEPLGNVLEEENMIWTRSCGNGSIVVTSFNLGMEPVNGWGFKAGFAARLLSEAPGEAAVTRMDRINSGYYNNNSYLLEQVYKGEAPNSGLLIAVLILFALFCPITYLILKKMNKSEYLWAAIPAEAVIMAAVILLSTLNLRVQEPMISSVTYFDKGNSAASGSMSIICPDNKDNVLHFTDQITQIKKSNEYYYGYSSSYADEQIPYRYVMRKDAQGYTMTIQSETNFEKTYCSFEVSNQGRGSLDADLSRNMQGISGTVTNNTGVDLKGVCVYTSNSIIMIGDLARGASASFTEEDNRLFYYIYDIDFAEIDRGSELYSLINNIYEDSYYECVSNKTDSESRVAVMGITVETETDYVADEKVTENNVLVFRNSMTIGYNDYPDAKIVELFDYLVGDYPNDWDPNDGQLYATSVETTFDLTGAMDQVYAILKGGAETTGYGDTSDTTICAYNYVTGAYEELFTNFRTTLEFSEECPYFRDGLIRMRFICSKEYEDYVPKMIIIGGDQ